MFSHFVRRENGARVAALAGATRGSLMMKKAMVFISAFALVLISGAAVAFMTTPDDYAGQSDAYEKDDGTTTTTIHEKEDPLAYPEKEEPTEPTKDEIPADEGDYEKPEEEVDDDPPDLVILFPENGQHFKEREVPFEGKTEPGATVYANGRRAEVDEEGNWRIVLALERGANEIYFKVFDQAENWSKVWITVYYDPPVIVKDPPKEDPPKVYEFWAKQKYGSCGEDPAYDKWYGVGEPGTEISITSDFGSGHTVIGESGEWWLQVFFEGAPCNEAFLVTLTTSEGHEKHYEFIRLCEEEGGGHEEGEK